MNLMEALGTGKPIRRPHWYEGHPDNLLWLYTNNGSIPLIGPGSQPLYIEDLKAVDWMILNKEVTITEDKFLEVVKEVREAGTMVTNSFLGIYEEPKLDAFINILTLSLFHKDK